MKMEPGWENMQFPKIVLHSSHIVYIHLANTVPNHYMVVSGYNSHFFPPFDNWPLMWRH